MKTKQDESRRDFIRKSTLLTIAGAGTLVFGRDPGFIIPETYYSGNTTEPELIPENKVATDFDISLPALPYSFDALEPFIDAATMQIHHGKHHQAYVDNLKKALQSSKRKAIDMESLIKNISKFPKAVRNNAGGHYNHSMFWKLMKPKGGGQPTGALAQAINVHFGNFENFKTQFTDAATKHFGSGWTWLVKKKDKLIIGTTDNQDNPLMDASDFRGMPVIGLDVWEHAYYLKYQNKRADYISAWWNVINWDEANLNFEKLK